MSSRSRSTRSRLTAAATCAVAGVGLAVSATQPAAAAPTGPATPASTPRHPGAIQALDLRQGGSAAQVQALAERKARLQASPAVRTYATDLGRQSLVDVDPATGTPREVSRLDGLLTGPSSSAPRSVVLGYLANHADVFRLSSTDLSRLTLARDYVDIAGIHHLSFTQSADGVPLFGNGVKAAVTKDGRLVSVSGAPVAGLAAPAAVSNGITGATAIRIAKTDVAEPSVAPGSRDTAKAVLFATPGGTRRAWETVTMSARRPTLDVVDAATGRLLYRQDLSSDFAADASGTTGSSAAASGDQYANVVTNYPGAAHGGTQVPADLTAPGWLPANSVLLYGNNAHTYTDVNDNNAPDQGEEISATGQQGFRFSSKRYANGGAFGCSTSVCSWSPNVPNSWTRNRSAFAAQNFYFVNNWHDYLEKAPIGFTEAAGNFQQVNSSGHGLGDDPVYDQSLDGASTANGLPDANHIDNANFATPPDGQSPTMQMYLWHQPGTKYPNQDPFVAVSGTDEADIVYHEYTHGLSHRLVVDASNVPALDSQQGGSMGEAWSDWYALDYLVNHGLITDTSKPDVEVGAYVLPGEPFRTEPTDCPVGSTSSRCPGGAHTGPGGYTYGDFGKISTRGIEVHADGEIWAQTLWDLRGKLGPTLTESLVTRGMELSPTLPSMLDMRNAIVLADQAIYGGKHVATIWQVFAHRGMGFFAGTVGGSDVHPVESFALPPAPNTPTATVIGTVKDSATGAPVSGAVVAFGGHDSGLPGSYTGTSNAQGRYSIAGVFAGTYPDVYAAGAGYDPKVLTALSVNSGTTTRNWSLVRDWAASSGGGSIASFTGPDYTPFGCGPSGDIDQSLGTGWGSTSDLSSSGAPTSATPKTAVIALPKAVDISTLGIDPSNTCGDDPTAATGGYEVDTSTDGTTWKTAATGTFTPADLGKLNTITPKAGTGTSVKYVRFRMLSPQAVTQHIGCPGAGASGCQFLDSSEVEVFGRAA